MGTRGGTGGAARGVCGGVGWCGGVGPEGTRRRYSGCGSGATRRPSLYEDRRFVVRLRRLVEVEVGLHDHVLVIATEVEAEALADALHGAVVQEDLGGDAPEPLGAADLEEPAQEQGAQAPALEVVADQDGELGPAGGGGAAAELRR